ncbi:amino acid ABC transporter permease [Nocardia brevicatena]|uniref:amino acid ABC transporter permease n=1 Tax=Nocardia brevicatena TaxID=37327 RepID=UPI00031637BF|nr:amino acid ABC transporter permease [Nocardia brevicatena]
MSGKASVLYDAPGPIARVRNIVYSLIVIAVVAAAAWYIVRGFSDQGQFTRAKWEPFLDGDVWTTYLLPGLRGTIVAAALSIVLAMVLGTVFGIARLSDHRWVRLLAGTIVEIARAIPVLILMFFLFALYSEYDVFRSEYLALGAVVTALTIYNGSVIAEIVRAGILALPKGQTEAAAALGMRKSRLMRLILLPQAVTAMLPALISQMVVALKDSALGYVITYEEVVRNALQLGGLGVGGEPNVIPALMVAAVIMITLNVTLSGIATRVERRLRTGRRKGTGVVAADSVITDAAPGVDIVLES